MIWGWSQINWFVLDLESSNNYWSRTLLGNQNNTEIKLGLKLFELIQVLDLESSLDPGIKSILESNWVWNYLIWFRCLIWNQVLSLEWNQYGNQTGFETIWFYSNAWSEIRSWSETTSTEIRPESEIIWIESGAWFGIKTWRETISIETDRSLKLPEQNHVVRLSV